ncbi:SH3 domain-containing protein [Thermoleptolyngbya sichuanensis XZ-Cy5]|uniref:SH3 domain-containing protein n=1 Tax=Thermoleptolyngbya sichuanensis TaxID=2885951 RepID=UPI00240CE92C|nr:SH3 domain-containing protein [Thermoleptolyngbya sichuanensis]MDG2615763.1 SH3 domain-containing protein [Thermoleptolyngbya sichuanensis XZ-Cy5]
MVLPGAIALLLTGCPPSTTSASVERNGLDDSPRNASAQPTDGAAETSLPKTDPSQPSAPPTAAKSSASEQDTVRQAVVSDPAIVEFLQHRAARLSSDTDPLSLIEVGTIAIADNYAVARYSMREGDLLDYYNVLLVKQNGFWVVADFLGMSTEITKARLVYWGVPEGIITQLVDMLRAQDPEIYLNDAYDHGDAPMPCTTQIEDSNPPTNVRQLAPASGVLGRVIGQLPNGTPVRVAQSYNGWLKIRQPLVGWVSMDLTRVSCGDSLAEVQQNLNALQAKEEMLYVEAADTLVRYLYRGAEGAFAEAAIARFNEFAMYQFYALEAAFDPHNEEVRRQVLQRVITAGMHPEARESFERAWRNRDPDAEPSPTLQTWRSLN